MLPLFHQYNRTATLVTWYVFNDPQLFQLLQVPFYPPSFLRWEWYGTLLNFPVGSIELHTKGEVCNLSKLILSACNPLFKPQQVPAKTGPLGFRGYAKIYAAIPNIALSSTFYQQVRIPDAHSSQPTFNFPVLG